MFQKNEDSLVHFVQSVRRCDKVVEGGKKTTYSVLVVVGDNKGKVGYALAKHKEVLMAKQKALKLAKKNLVRISLKENRTIYHDISCSHGATSVILRSAPSGTGIVAGGPMRDIFTALGIKDIVAKCIGSSCSHNLVLTTFMALKMLRTPKNIAIMRRKTVDEIIRNSKDVLKSVQE